MFNVHRWSLEEDITLLKAVPLMGHMWAEVSSRLIPHRDRGHLRKRYQVLERRVKATLKREKKNSSEYRTSEVGGRMSSSLKAKVVPAATRSTSPKQVSRTAKSSGKKRKSAGKSNAKNVTLEPAFLPCPGRPVSPKPNNAVHNAMPCQKFVPHYAHPNMPPQIGNSSVPASIISPMAKMPSTAHKKRLVAKAKLASVCSDLGMSEYSAKTTYYAPHNRPESSAHFGSMQSNVGAKSSMRPNGQATPPKSDIKKNDPFCSSNLSRPKQSCSGNEVGHGEDELLCSEKIGSMLPDTNLPNHSNAASCSTVLKDKTLVSASKNLSPMMDCLTPASQSGMDNTRMGIERILNNGDEWSQASRMKQLIENGNVEHGTSASITATSHLSMSEAVTKMPMHHVHNAASVGRLPHLEMNAASSSGFSVLNDSRDGDLNMTNGLMTSPLLARTANSAGRSKPLPSGSIMSNVLERTKARSARQRSLPAKKKIGAKAIGDCHDAPHMPLPLPPPADSKKEEKVDGVPSPCMYTSPPKSIPFGSHLGDMSGLTFPAPMGDMSQTIGSAMGPGPVTMMCDTGKSMDGFEGMFSISERSMQALEGEGGNSRFLPAATMQSGTPGTFTQSFPNGVSSTFSCPNSLMANDLDAITALKDMSNSGTPALSPVGARPDNHDYRQSEPANVNTSPETNPPPKKSLFAKAVMSIREKEPKKRLT
mmetsp:Transcript_56845/g.84564  ORF Transcript_56845/g.84564 Transcript_56845/m.84564 type:complete len:706 (-) Transcript_56845:565-2682(-)